MKSRSGPGSADVERPLVDPEALSRYLDDKVPGDGTFSVERHQAGHSNETFFVGRSGHQWVLRRPPRGAFLPTAHDVLREYRVLDALADTAARAPRPVLACQDESVIGVPFYLMEKVEGVVIRDRLPDGLDDTGRRRIGEELVDALAELHAVDWQAIGLEGWGKSTGYLDRQLRRWGGQLALASQHTRPLPGLEKAAAWLAEHRPDSPPSTIVHGDYKLDNVVLQSGPPPKLVSILDWEMSTIGDPFADVGYLLSFWREAGDPPDPVLAEQGEITRQAGFVSRAEIIDRYAERSGRRPGDLTWYVVLALWKVAILLEGSYARHLAGVTDDPFFALLEEGVPWERLEAAFIEAYRDVHPESVVARVETGAADREEFEIVLATALSEGRDTPIDSRDLIRRMLKDVRLDDAMVEAVRTARRRGVRTGLLSNSWGVDYYPHDLLEELFDDVVISGQVGMRKPDPEVFLAAARNLEQPPEACVFVDDIRANVEAAERVGMRGVLHERTEETIPRLEELLGVSLRAVGRLEG